MKSPVSRKKTDEIVLQWDQKAQSSSNLRKNAHIDDNKQRSLDEYFRLLEEIKPHIQELKHTKLFDKPFYLFYRESLNLDKRNRAE